MTLLYIYSIPKKLKIYEANQYPKLNSEHKAENIPCVLVY